jgi:tripartite-type tricarboxylate transporter receptor subunit TctC
LSKALGQPVVIENKPGAGGNIGVDLVAKSQDGHTIGFTTNGPLTSSKPLYAKLPFDPAKDIRPLSLCAVSPLVLAIDNNVPASNLKEFISWAKAQDQGVSYGSIGNGSGSHLTMELFGHRAGLRMLHVPYQGFPQVTSAIIAHDVQSGFMAPSGALIQSKAGKMRILGISSSRKSELLPDVPTIAEGAGLPDFNAELWIAAFAPASMPDAAAQRVAAEINALLRQPEARAKLAEQGWESRGDSSQVLSKRIADDTRLWERVIQQSNIRAE